MPHQQQPAGESSPLDNDSPDQVRYVFRRREDEVWEAIKKYVESTMEDRPSTIVTLTDEGGYRDDDEI